MIQSDTIQVTPEVLGLIAKIDEFKGAWRALGALAPDRLTALRRVATIETPSGIAELQETAQIWWCARKPVNIAR